MEDFEACAEPLQDCLNATEQVVRESSTRLHDLTGKKQELHKLQVLVLPIGPQHFSCSQPLIFKCQVLLLLEYPSCHLQKCLNLPNVCPFSILLASFSSSSAALLTIEVNN